LEKSVSDSRLELCLCAGYIISTSMKLPVLLQRGEAKAMWGLCWRMIVLAPIGILGVGALTLVMGLSILPPVYAAFLIYFGDYLWAVLILMGWGLWLRFGGSVREFVSEGWEHGSL
jgi:hypothetical protein